MPQGRRLGMGGGFYDRALGFRRQRRHWMGPRLVGFAFECQRADSVFAEPWDVRLDALATESGSEKFLERHHRNEPLAPEVRTLHLQHRSTSRPGPSKTTAWDGVRNYQARNMLRDSMKKGDTAFFYHSSCEVPGIAGIVRVVKEGYPDETAFDPKHHHYDAGQHCEAILAGSWST